VYIATDNDKEIRAAAPASPRRLVRQLRSPADSAEDWRVGYLRVSGEREEHSRSVEVTFFSSSEPPGEAEQSRCANCGKVSAKNRACRGCLVAHFCNSECYREGWGDHKAACKLAAATMNKPEEEAAYVKVVCTALASGYSPAQIPTDAQIITRLGRILSKRINLRKRDIKKALARNQTPDISFSEERVIRQLEVDLGIKALGISLDDRSEWIMAEIDKYVANLPSLKECGGTWASGIPPAGGGRPAVAGTGAGAGDDVRRRIAAAGPAGMAAYWTRVGELRAKHLPEMTQAHAYGSEHMAKGAQFTTQKAEQLFSWMSTTAIPMLQQMEASPCGLAKFTLEELDSLEEQVKKMIVDVYMDAR
jgi:hypothetical protein